MGETLLIIGCIVFAANFFSLLFSKKKIPDVLFLMLIGIILCPILGVIHPNDFGKIGSVLTTVTLVFILFNGGLDIKIEDLRRALRPTFKLTFASIFLTITIIAIVGYINGLSLLNSFILGSILCGIAATVVIPLTNVLKINKDTKTTLVLESALSDVICLILSLALIDAAKIGEGVNYGHVIGNIFSSFLIATLIGILSGFAWGAFIRRIKIFKYSMFSTTAYVFIIYGITEILGYSGAIAALVFGILLANLREFHQKFFKKIKMDDDVLLNDGERKFNDEIGFILKTSFFVYIGICIPFNDWSAIGLGALITALLLIQRTFVSKHFSPNSANTFDKSIIATTVQKGLASAVLASLPLQYGIAGGEKIQSITFAVILLSIIASSLLIIMIGKFPFVANIYKKYYSLSAGIIKPVIDKASQKIGTKLDKLKSSTFFDDEEEEDNYEAKEENVESIDDKSNTNGKKEE